MENFSYIICDITSFNFFPRRVKFLCCCMINKTYHWNRYFLRRDDPELTLSTPFNQISHKAVNRYAIAILCTKGERRKMVCVIQKANKCTAYMISLKLQICSLAVQNKLLFIFDTVVESGKAISFIRRHYIKVKQQDLLLSFN